MENPVQKGIRNWLRTVVQEAGGGDEWIRDHLKSAPKKFTIYRPMVQLPAGSFTGKPWDKTLTPLDNEESEQLWMSIVQEVAKRERGSVTHLAVVEGIPLHKNDGEEKNILRSPGRLRMLYGDFGPAEIQGDNPSEEDFHSAFWVHAKQNGIWQTWTPRWTMFSKGNIEEKTRLLKFDKAIDLTQWAVDLYAGIGYFAFSYAALGFRVLCWELNPWSVEGLRRGGEENKWSVRVFQGEELNLSASEMLAGGEQILVFLEDNQEALRRIRIMQENLGLARDIKHVNCGLLPTSEPVWRMAFDMTDQASDSCLHLHENVGADDISARGEDIETRIGGWAADQAHRRLVKAEHIEQVKTYAPGVWHCVFDIHVQNEKC